MEIDDKSVKKKNGFSNDPKEIAKSLCLMLEHTTVVDLSNKNLLSIEDNVKFPPNLVELNLSYNRLTVVPDTVQKLDKLKSLDISHNLLTHFDNTPDFCHSIEVLDLSYNNLLGPPCWAWIESPAKLLYLDLSFNMKITNAFVNGYLEELMQFKMPAVHVKMNNCDISRQHWNVVSTFSRAKVLYLGSNTLSLISGNRIIDLPCEGLEKCCDLESIYLSNTHIYNIKSNIDVFSNVIEIDLSQNYITGLPQEFCNLVNLEKCILSENSLLYLPENIGKLKKLVTLHLDSNELCLLPDSIVELTNLDSLDIYNNCLYEYPDIKWVTGVDVAQNFFDEPDDPNYVRKKEKLRSRLSGRFDGRKIEPVRPDSDYSPRTSDEEEHLSSISNGSNSREQKYDPPSSPEDWDSDSYWVPHFSHYSTQHPHSPWLNFVKQKMAEGNFCPMDVHTVSITEKVKYEKLCKPKLEYESDGQFDDFSDDNS